jgi:L-asparaginase / beta-aspartyl-peptidase
VELRDWNFATPWEEAVRRFGHGTVGAVARDAQGHFAVATSTGGSPPALLGRVGDTPIVGCGFYCGPHGAVAVSSIAEYVVRDLVAYQVYRWIEDGRPVQQALDDALARYGRVDLGIIAVSATGAGSASNKQMPVGVRER